MATVTDLNTTPLSGLTHIDALLDVGPDWNYLTPVGNTLLFTFSISTGTESGRTGLSAFSAAQQSAVNTALAELHAITGIDFVLTDNGDAAQIHFCNMDIKDSSSTTGLCSWQSSYSYSTGNTLVSYDADAYVYLDNNEWYAQNRDLVPGGYGYETLLHELGHALGLKHPFDDSINLPTTQDNTSNTLMSYTGAGGPYQHYNQYDVAALEWLYGGDGLRGALGVNSTTGARYIMGTNGNDSLHGTAFDDTLEGDGGSDIIDGGAGTDTVVFRGPRSNYTFTQLDNGGLLVAGPTTTDGTDTLMNIEILKFSDGSFQRAQVADTTPPLAPTLSVTRNAAGYAPGATPLVTGSAEAGSTVKVYSGDVIIGTTQVDATGIWSLTTKPFADGLNYKIYATATDAAGNTSTASAALSFNIDAHAPTIPLASLLFAAGSNQPSFSGTGEAGTIIQLVNVINATEIGRTTVHADGSWQYDAPALPNSSYSVVAVSVDVADNATSAAGKMDFTINSKLNFDGSAGADRFTPGAGNNAVDGKGGLDVVAYGGARAGFTVAKDVFGYAVTDTNGLLGHDTLVNVERVQFSDTWLALDIDGAAGKVYRMYQAAFDRTPDARGYAYWLDAMDHGYTLNQVTGFVLADKEATALYMADPSDQYFITQLYHHVLHREPEGAGYAWWLDNVQKASRADVLAMFSESPENQAQVIGTIQNGIEYHPWGSA
jgi:serralysin